MEKKKIKRLKFHDALISVLYPPPPPPPPQCMQKKDVGLEEISLAISPDESLDSEDEDSPSDDSYGDCSLKKLTRAQRKRLRRKKLKEAASCPCRKVIGPLMDGNDYNDKPVQEDSVSKMIGNSIQDSDAEIDIPDDPRICTTQNKLKQRRMTKRLKRDSADRQSNGDFDHQGT
ncbi:hypothetical protein GIB67_004179 [Kingdonia uniflora]|uniref:Uncharacterized protein n=1 Tax=Kingdonia uniflora TaxID=39325 RepID=A0A7J7LM94_9MAGN|nr:hypothetical protein GIB67_004179 [Kingdonia uniflora]